MRIGQKLMVGFVAVGIFVVLASIIAVIPIGKGIAELGEFHTPALYSIQVILTGTMEAVEESFAYVVSGQKSEKEDFRAWVEKFDLQVKEFGKIANIDKSGEEEEKALFETIVADHDDLVKKATVMFNEFEAKGSISHETFMEYENVIDKLQIELNKFTAIEKAEVEEAHRDALGTIKRSQKIIYGIGFFAVILAIGIGYSISRIISVPIIKLKDAAVDIAQGNMDAKIEVKPGDEIGELAEAFDNMRTSLKVVMEEYEKKEKKE